MVGAGGSAAAIGAGAAVDDDDAGVVIVTPFAWASLSFSQNFFQWNWMQNGDLVLEWGALLGWAVCTNGFHRRKVGRIEVAFLYTHQAISINFVRSNPSPQIDRGGWMAERKKTEKKSVSPSCVLHLLIAHVFAKSPLSKQAQDIIYIELGERGCGCH